MQRIRPLKKLHLNILKPRIHARQRLGKFCIPGLRWLRRCGRASFPLPGFEELLAHGRDFLRGQFAVLVLIRFGETLEYSRPLRWGGALRWGGLLCLRIGAGRRRQQSEGREVQDGVLLDHGLRLLL